MAKKGYWIGVACKAHLFVGVKGGFTQLHHSTKTPLQKINEGNWHIYYSPRLSLCKDEECQSFTAVDREASGEVYQFDLGEGFLPDCLLENVERCEETSILPFINRLSFIENGWGNPFRLGHLEITEEDFELLAEEMHLDGTSIRH